MNIFIWGHLILSTILVVKFYYNNRVLKNTIGYALILISFPIGGILIVYILYSTNPIFSSSESKYDPLTFFNDEKDRFSFAEELNTVEETRVIPIQKALMLEDYIRRRETILNLIKKDINNYSKFMNLALANNDSETSHYAASSILHTKRILDNNLNNASELYSRDPNIPVVIVAYADQLMDFINNDYLDYDIKNNYIYENVNVLKRIVDEKIDLDCRHMFNLIELLLITKDYVNIYKYCNLLMDYYPNTEEKYILVLKSYYMMKDFTKFQITLEKFRASGITFSKETMDIVRFWLGGQL